MGSNLLIAIAATLLAPLPQSTNQSTQTLQQRDTIGSDDSGGGIAYERMSDAFQYNRVQGLSLGAGYRFPLSGVPKTNVYATIRYGLTDERVTGRLSMIHDDSGTRVVLSGYYDLADIDPFATGRSLSNSLNALFAAHDNGDYLLARGGSVRLETMIGPALELTIHSRVERENSVRREAESEVNDFLGGNGSFPPNPDIREGTFGLAAATLGGIRKTRWNLTTDLLIGSGQATPRLYGDIRRSLGWLGGITLRVKSGVGTRPTLPQTLFRLGGLGTVRGFEYGFVRSQAFWAAQLDVAPLEGRIRPLAFLDAGQGAEISGLFSSTALVGGGVGLSLFSGLIRFDLSHPISPDLGGNVRFDVTILGVR